MDAKDLRTDTALGDRNDASKYSQSGVALQCNRIRSYHDIGSNASGKAEAAVRPCAVIGPDRVVPPAHATTDPFIKKSSVELWNENMYPRPPEYSYKPLSNVNPTRNISPRQTFQENMQRIMVSPTYSAVNHTDESSLNHTIDRNAVLTKSKSTMAPESKYCDVPYPANLLTNEHKSVIESELCVPTVNSPQSRNVTHAWPPNGVMHGARTYGAPDIYQYPQYPSCPGTRPPVLPIARPNRTYQEDGYSYHESIYQDPSVRFKPYPTMKDRYPQARYEYTNYPNPFHPPPPYPPHKYDIPNPRHPHPFPMYSHLKYLDNRVHEPNIEQYQRPTQQPISYNMQFRNQVIHPTYSPALGNKQNKGLSFADSAKPSSKPIENNKAYIDYENAKAKYPSTDSYFVNELTRTHQAKPQSMPNYTAPGLHPVQMQQLHRKDIPLKPFEYMPHYRHYEYPIGFNPITHHLSQFSPNTLAISPTDSNTSNDTTQTQGTSQEDCGYVSQSSTTSVRSVETSTNRLPNEYYRRYDYRYRPVLGNSHIMHPKAEINTNNSKDHKKIDVRQFLSMWNEGEEENCGNNNAKEPPAPKITSDLNTYTKRQEMQKSQDELYVLGLVNVPSEELSKYEHIQKISKLPENIKGYNNIELLNQFEEVINSSNLNNFKSPPSKDYNLKCKNALRQMAEVLPRPVSPLDVESKISQSVIHKEVGCNFEIKPCSPKMMNVEIAAPVQNILGERMIEKVSNPHSNKAKSPLTMRVDGTTTRNKMQRQEGKHASYEGPSCKMVGSPFTANNMESVKNNYSLHDLETSSGVCLASLPRLDNEIELNFPEVNQQFINANKGDQSLLTKYSHDAMEDNLNLTIPNENNAVSKNDSVEYLNVSVQEDVLTKLSKYRKTKVALEENEPTTKAIRTDSVIIKNPDNYRRYEENRSPYSIEEEEHTPMNLTSQSISHAEGTSANMDVENNEMHNAIECALDFSISRSGNGLPIINSNEDETTKTSEDKDATCVNDMIETDDSFINDSDHNQNDAEKNTNECDPDGRNATSIIMENKRSRSSDCGIKIMKDPTHSSTKKTMKSIDKSKRSDEHVFSNSVIQNREDAEITRVNNDNIDDEIKFDSDLLNSDISPNVNFVAEETESCNIAQFAQKQDCPRSSLIQMHENSRPTTTLKTKSKKTVTVIHNNDIHDDSDVQNKSSYNVDKDENVETNSAIDKLSRQYNNTEAIAQTHKEDYKSERLDIHLSVDSENAEGSSNIADNLKKVDFSDAGPKFCSTSHLITDKNKYYNALISMDELLMDKSCPSRINQLCNTFVEKGIASNVIEATDGTDFDRVEPSSEKKSDLHNDTIVIAEVADINDILEPAASIHCDKFHKDLESKTESVKDENNFSIDHKQHINIKSIDKGHDNTVDVSTIECVEGKTDTQNIFSSEYENNSDKTPLFSDRKNHNASKTIMLDSNVINNLPNTNNHELTKDEHNTTQYEFKVCEFKGNSDTTQVFSDLINSANKNAINNDSEDDSTMIMDPEPTAETDNNHSMDSGYQTNKNSFIDEDKIDALENSMEDIDPKRTEVKKDEVLLTKYTENSSAKNYIQNIPDISKTATNSSIIDNDTEEDSNLSNKMELLENVRSSILPVSDDNEKKLLEKLEHETSPDWLVGDLKNITCDINLNNETTNKQKNEMISAEIPQLIGDGGDQLDKTLETIFTENIKDNNDGDESKETKYLVFEKETKNEDIQMERHEIQINSVHSQESMELFEDLVNSREKLYEGKKEVTGVLAVLNTKKYLTYLGKHLNSPWIQKLMIYNEGKINDVQYKDDIIVTKSQNGDEQVTCVHKTTNIDSVLNELTPNLDFVNNSDCVADTIKDINDVDNKKINSESDDEESAESLIKECLDQVILFDENNINEPNQEDSSDLNINNKQQCEIEKACIEECDVQTDMIDTEEISFSYPNSSIISQITENIFQADGVSELKCEDNNEKQDVECEDVNLNNTPINHRLPLKRSYSDSALNTHVSQNEDMHYIWPPKRNRIGEFENFITNNRRNSVNIEENVSFCILIDNNCIITEENEEKICFAEIQEDYIETTEIDASNDEVSAENMKELISSPHEPNVDFAESVFMECEAGNSTQELNQEWIEDIGNIETVFSDEVAENVIISAPSSPTDSVSEDQCDATVGHDDTAYSPTDEVNFIYDETISIDTAQVKEPLYRTLQSDMDKTLTNRENYDSDNLSDIEQDNLIESDNWKPSPTDTPDYMDPAHTSSDFRLETPENKENIYVKELSPLRRIDDYLDESSAENETDDRVQDLNSGKADNVSHYGDEHMSCTSSSSPEVSSTTSEEKCSSILLKITNLNGSRVSQINESNKRPRCKFTEKKEYSSSDLNFPNGPLITKAAQKYIPPIKESIRDLKVQISLPQQRLLKLKQLKISQSKPKLLFNNKPNNVIPRVARKPKPNFDDVLKSIDEIQIKMHKEKSKKTKTAVPKVVIKKNQNGSHYASIPKKDTFNPDLTGRKWQPWVFIEKNDFIDKMAIKKQTQAIFSHRKNTFVLAEKFKKYKSVCSTKFVITQPKASNSTGQLKYTIRLKHTY